MQVDSDNGYMGDYNYDAYYPSFGGDLGMLEILKPTKNSRPLRPAASSLPLRQLYTKQ